MQNFKFSCIFCVYYTILSTDTSMLIKVYNDDNVTYYPYLIAQCIGSGGKIGKLLFPAGRQSPKCEPKGKVKNRQWSK